MLICSEVTAPVHFTTLCNYIVALHNTGVRLQSHAYPLQISTSHMNCRHSVALQFQQYLVAGELVGYQVLSVYLRHAEI